jgi:predicted HAD superfamily hydrolase
MSMDVCAVETVNSDINDTVYPHDLLAAFDHYLDKITTLSLDCFDTLLWRLVTTPVDVFYILATTSAYKSRNLTAWHRIQAENQARNEKNLSSSEFLDVSLAEIYQAMNPSFTKDDIDELIAAEIATEMDVCYAHPIVYNLIRKAYLAGIQVIVVSDTYLSAEYLTRILKHSLPADVLEMISQVFCSSDYGKIKYFGLFNTVIKERSENFSTVLHIGDNKQADYNAPQALGMHVLHFVHYDNDIAEIMRMNSLAAGILDREIGWHKPKLDLYAGVLASATYNDETPERYLGYAVLGPLMYSFASYVIANVSKMRSEGKKVKVGFLMRDGHLPSVACDTLFGESFGYKIRISRFASWAASFITVKDVENYLQKTAFSSLFEERCHQLLLDENQAKDIAAVAESYNNPFLKFKQLILEENTLSLILERSAQYRKRLLNYLRKSLGLKAGDHLVLVDLGYTGTTQMLLSEVIEKNLKIKLSGMYLLSLSSIGKEHIPKKGLLSQMHCDERLLISFTSYISLFEQLCTANERSTIDYTESGEPVYEQMPLFAAKQRNSLELIQDECVQFIRDAKIFFKQIGKDLSEDWLRDVTIAGLGRLLFFSTAREIDFLRVFKFDMNLGSNDTLDVFNEEKGLEGLRKKGFHYMESYTKNMRTNYPTELRYGGLELVVFLLTQQLTRSQIMLNDISLRHEQLPVIGVAKNADGQIVKEALVYHTARYTHDGYFAIDIPLSNNVWNIAVQFGKNYEWVALESAEFIAVKGLHAINESSVTNDVSEDLAVEDMVHISGGLYECKSNLGMLVYLPRKPTKLDGVLRIVFRPVVKRELELENQEQAHSFEA